MKPALIPVAIAAVLTLSGCDRPPPDATVGAGAVETTTAKASVEAAPSDVVAAVKCWGLVQGSNVFHRALPEQAAGLPEASSEQKVAWFNEALRRADAAGMTVNEFAALQAQYQMSNRFTVRKVREEAVEPLRDCLARTPQDLSEPPQLAEG